jgi:N-acetylglucosamine-6-phosphate deacetylase
MMPAGGYIDLQVNGYGGVDFNQDGLTPEGLRLACETLQRDNVSAVLATIITDHVDVMCRRLSLLTRLRERDELARSVIAGIHIEGPFLSATDGYRGAHPADAVTQADIGVMERLLDAAGGLTRLVTLAPERDPRMEVTRMLVRRGVTVSAGHCDCSLDQLDGAIDAGLTMFTHLGNACPILMHRHDNLINRVLSRADRLWVCVIADGVHVPYFVLGNYLKLLDPDRCIVVSDAMAAAGLGPGLHRIGRWETWVGDDLAAWAPDKKHLLGSAMGLRQASINLQRALGLSDAAITALTYDNPRRAIRLSTGQHTGPAQHVS